VKDDNMKQTSLKTAALALVGTIACATPGHAADENVMIVFDGSNSMWGQIDGTAKIEIARDVMENLLGDWTETREVGLMAYGHRRRGDCTDIETLVAPGQETRADILARIRAITPTGKTPLTSAVEQAATEMSYTDMPATVILISDGLESCERDPCALADVLEKGGIGFTAHVVGFGLGDEDASALSCLADKTGGQYLSAGNADELGKAFASVSTAVSAAEPEPQPELEPEYNITLEAPDVALIGSEIRVSWTGAVDGGDYVSIVPMGAEEGSSGNYVRVRDDSENDLRMPSETGLYELRYVLNEGRRTLASRPIEITEPEVTLSGPDTALTGSEIRVSWTGAVDGGDYVSIVPMGAKEGSSGNSVRVRDDSENDLRMPSDTGLYELRYVLKEGRRTLASHPIEITAPEVTLDAPDTAKAGSEFPVRWTGAVDGGDYVNIVPMGAEEGSSGNFVRVRDDSGNELRAPSETGLYELRYVLKEGRRTLASRPIEITEPEVTLSGPDEIRAEDTIRVTWTGAVDGQDYITIVPVGTPETEQGAYARVRGNSDAEIDAPAETGLYELRYVLKEGRRVLARHPVEVLAADATLQSGASLLAPDTAATGATIEVSWSVESDSADQRITLAQADQAIFTWISAVRIEGAPPVTLTLPAAPGQYELRLLDVAGQAVLARKIIEVQ
jgi:Ca-activated chloride channel family protein